MNGWKPNDCWLNRENKKETHKYDAVQCVWPSPAGMELTSSYRCHNG